MKMKWLTITVCWGATTFPKSGVQEHGKNAQHGAGLCHPEPAAVCSGGVSSFIAGPSSPGPASSEGKCKHAYALHCGAGGSGQEAKAKIIAELLLWNSFPPLGWAHSGSGLPTRLGKPGKAQWERERVSRTVWFVLLVSLRAWFSPGICFAPKRGAQLQGRKVFQYETLGRIAFVYSLTTRIKSNTASRWFLLLWDPSWSTMFSPNIRRFMLNQVQRKPVRWGEGWNTSPAQAGWEGWGSSCHRREGSGEILSWPFSI